VPEPSTELRNRGNVRRHDVLDGIIHATSTNALPEHGASPRRVLAISKLATCAHAVDRRYGYVPVPP
jgi:hypothetical protein